MRVPCPDRLGSVSAYWFKLKLFKLKRLDAPLAQKIQLSRKPLKTRDLPLALGAGACPPLGGGPASRDVLDFVLRRCLNARNYRRKLRLLSRPQQNLANETLWRLCHNHFHRVRYVVWLQHLADVLF